jgi:Uma2 family endonuclease
MVESMSTLTLELRPREEQRAFNLRRWDEILADPELHKFEGRVETDRHGRVQLTPVLHVEHGRLEGEVGFHLANLMQGGHTMVVCPVSTADGVRAIDTAWASEECWRKLGDLPFYLDAPEICVEVTLPENSPEETREKIALYFDAGAKEVWTCDPSGKISFFGPGSKRIPRSKLCPRFPSQI